MDYIKIGWIMNTHGIKGEIKVQPLTDDVNRFKKLKTIYLGEFRTKVEIDTIKIIKDTVVLKIHNLDDINEARNLKGKDIYIDEKDRIDLPENKYFIFDIIGCKVFDMEGNKIGVIIDVMQQASNDVYIVKDRVKNKEYLIPAVKEFFVNVDISKKTIIINPIEGMLE